MDLVVSKLWQNQGGRIYFCSLRLQVREFLNRGGYKKVIGDDAFFETKEEAINEIYSRLNKDICGLCEQRIFIECNTGNQLEKPASINTKN